MDVGEEELAGLHLCDVLGGDLVDELVEVLLVSEVGLSESQLLPDPGLEGGEGVFYGIEPGRCKYEQ